MLRPYTDEPRARLRAGSTFAEGLDFGVGQDSGGLFGGGQDAIHFVFVGGDFVAFEPEHHVGFPAHRADFDDLVEAEEMGGDATVDDVGQGWVAVKGFDDGRGVDAGRGAEGVVADDRIIRRDRGVRRDGDFFAIFLEAREIAIDQAHQAQVDEHEFHRRVADTLAERICCGVDLICAAGDGCERIGDGETAIVVSVPVDANVLAAGLDDFVDGKFDEVVGALRRGVTDGIAKNNGARTVVDSGRVETLYRFPVGANRVFGDEHRRQVVFDDELDGFFGGALEVIDGPVFDEAADRAGTEECRGFDGDADALRNFGDGADVGFDGTRGAVRADFHPVGGDFAREGFSVLDGAWAGAG